MFLSAGTTVKFHHWPPQDNQTKDTEYIPFASTPITHASWCNDSNYLAVLSENGNPEIVETKDTNSARLVHTVQVLPNVTALAFQKTTKKYLVLGTANAQIALYDTKHRAITKLYTNLTSAVCGVDCNLEDHCMAAACKDGSVAVYDMSEAQVCETFKMPHMASPTALRFHPTSPNHLAACSENGDVLLWDIAAAKKIFCAQSHTQPARGLALSSTDALLVSVGEDHKLCVYDINMGECTFRSNLQEPLSAVDAMIDGHCMAIGTFDGNVYVYDMRHPVQPVHTFQPHTTRITKILFENQFPRSKVHIHNPLTSNVSDVNTSIVTSEELNESKVALAEMKENTSSVVVTETALYENLKKAMLKSVRVHISDLCSRLTDYFVSLKEVMENEIATLDTAIDEKCLSLISLLTDEENKASESSMSELKEQFAS